MAAMVKESIEVEQATGTGTADEGQVTITATDSTTGATTVAAVEEALETGIEEGTLLHRARVGIGPRHRGVGTTDATVTTTGEGGHSRPSARPGSRGTASR